MAGSSDAGRPETDLARIGLGVRYELGDRLGRNGRIDHHDEGETDDARDGGDIAEENEIELVVESGVDRVRRAYNEERVAVRRRPYGGLGTNVVPAARAVFDDELLTEPLREPWRDEPRDNIGCAGGSGGSDDAHRPRRIGLRLCNTRQRRKSGRARGEMQEFAARKFHRSPLRVRRDCTRVDGRGRAMRAWIDRTNDGPSGMPADGISLPPTKGGLRHVPLGELES